MTELKPNTVEASQEKHLPVVTIEGNIVKVKVGSVELYAQQYRFRLFCPATALPLHQVLERAIYVFLFPET